MYPETWIVRQNFGQDNDGFCTEVPPKLEEVFGEFGNNLIVKPQIAYQNHDELNKFKDSHILILGGGPSVNEIDWHPLEYDYIWSMSHCFYNKKINSIGVDFMTIGCGVDLEGKEFNEFINKFNPIIAFELHVKYYRPGPKLINNLKLVHDCYRNNRKICYQTKWYSQLGTGARQLIFACELQPSKISFLGFDGPEPIYQKNHAFVGENDPRDNIHKLPGSIRHLSYQEVLCRFTYEYDKFWEYIRNNYPKTKLDSIDKSNRYHRILNDN